MGSLRTWRHRCRMRQVRRFVRALPPEARQAAYILMRGLRRR